MRRQIRTFSGFLLRCIRSNSARSGAASSSPENRSVFTLCLDQTSIPAARTL